MMMRGRSCGFSRIETSTKSSDPKIRSRSRLCRAEKRFNPADGGFAAVGGANTARQGLSSAWMRGRSCDLPRIVSKAKGAP